MVETVFSLHILTIYQKEKEKEQKCLGHMLLIQY